jgi:hypothetical protein
MEQIIIHRLGQGAPIRLAARELRRYLSRLTGLPVVVHAARAHTPAAPGLWLGLFADLGLSPARGGDPVRDDEVAIRTGPTSGVIAGSNERSVLLAAYRYLTALGCRWVRPGKTGEYVPSLGPRLPAVNLREKASYRHRGVCIEGAVSWEHARDMVDWLPKLGFNAYFIQFREAHTFFQRWYEHWSSPSWPGEPLPVEEARALTGRLRAEIKQRGLLLHMVGHGWTCEPFGLPNLGWKPHEGPVPPEVTPYLAELDGKRALFGNVAVNTNLCYGNPQAREILTGAVVDYARANPEVDIIHVWLSDGANNQCECPLCRDHRPSDLYVTMLNELDAKLTQAGLPVRIVFLAYVDLLWPPRKETLRNPDRFILMFAPITRSYSTSFTDVAGAEIKLHPYRRNRLQFPADPAANLAFLRAWQSRFPGEGFDFDYHFMWDHYKDPGQWALARVLHRDLQGLHKIGLDGFMSCQVQRIFFPTGLGMTVLGRTLWNRRLSLQSIAEDYCRAAFGEGGDFVLKYLRTLSRLFAAPVIRGEGTEADRQAALEGWRKIPAILEQAEEAITRGLQSADPCRTHSWELLREHADFCRLLSAALLKKHEGSAEEARTAALQVAAWAQRRERRLHHVFDVFEFLLTMGRYLGLTPEDWGGKD